jgi:XTP/dITP diphosphohydrolase
VKEIIFATGNKGKIREVKEIFEGSDFQIVSLSEVGEVFDIPEDGDTYEENALIKAKAVYSIYKTPVMADDSGLSVEQLDGGPGVYSARYAGENCTYDDNNRKLLKELESFPKPHLAKFVSCAVYYDGNEPVYSIGELKGQIVHEFKGTNGFGYDPVFIPDGFNKTLAEMTLEEKNGLSHRAIAFRGLKEKLQ